MNRHAGSVGGAFASNAGNQDSIPWSRQSQVVKTLNGSGNAKRSATMSGVMRDDHTNG